MAGHQWWRVSNIVNRTGNANLSIAEMRFLNEENIACNNLNNAFSASAFSGDYVASKAFDNNPQTLAHSNTSAPTKDWYIGYQFDVPVTVTSLQLQMRQDMGDSYGQEWQSANVEYSDDGINWQFYGVILPIIAQMDLSLKTVVITNLDLINIAQTNNSTTSINIYTQNEQGSITGSVKEMGLPANAEIALSDRKTRQLIAIVRSQNYTYIFKGIDKNREYYVHGIDDDRSCNAVTQDMLPGNYDALKVKGLL